MAVAALPLALPSANVLSASEEMTLSCPRLREDRQGNHSCRWIGKLTCHGSL